MDTMSTVDKAKELGAEHGKNAASWYFDGNTPEHTYRRVLTGIENGDSEVLDTFPHDGLSGEFADGFSSRDLEVTLEIDPENESTDFGDVCDAYTDAFNTAVCEEITRAATYHLAHD